MTCLCAERISRQIKEKYNEYSKYAAPELQPRAPLEWKLRLLLKKKRQVFKLQNFVSLEQ
jgi:hypothetical protein